MQSAMVTNDEDETFYKRPGTTDVGKDFEDLNIANYILNFLCEENLINFKLSSNDNNYGVFDDIILEIDNNKKLDTYAIQLKHVNDNKQLTLKALTGESGNFCLKKYYESFKKVIKKPCQLILLSNIKFGLNNNQKDKENIQIQFGDDTLKICKKDLNKIISASGNCYQFELITNNSPEIDEYKKFFDNFFLYTDQPNVKQVEESIKTMFQEMFGESADYKKYTEFISQWSKREGTKEKLNKELMQRVVTLLLVKPFIEPFVFGGKISENAKIFRETISEFNVTTFDEKFRDKVTKLWGDKLILNDIKKLNKIKIKYQMDCNNIKNIDDIDNTNLSIFLWLLNDIPLILFENEIVNNTIKFCKIMKFILLQQYFKRISIENCRIFQNLNDLNNDKILTNFKWCVQGKNEKNLNYLIELNNDFDKSVVTTNELIQMIDGPLKIEDEKETLPVPYIDRELTKNVIDYKFLDNLDKNTLILIDCVNNGVIKNVLNKHKLNKLKDFLEEDEENENFHYKNLKMTSTYETGLILISKHICEKAIFDKLCSKKAEFKNIFHFRVGSGDNLEWIRSRGDFQILEQFRLNNVYIKEKDLCSMKHENKINLIITEAGMGKSELLKHFKNTFFENYWMVLLTSKDMELLCDKFSSHTGNSQLFLEYVLDNKIKDITNFNKEVLNMFLKQNKTIYLWDALDELIEERQKIIINLISDLSRNNCCQWITSRCHLKQKLETRFEVLSRELVPFNTEQQEFYIEERLKMSNIENISEIRKKIMKAIFQIKDNNILAIPLQIFMMTELFRQNSEKYFLLIKDLFSLTDLYEYFIDEKLNFSFKEKANTTTTSRNFVKQLKKLTLKQYEKIAIKTLFPKNEIEKLKINCEEECEDIEDPIGLLINVRENKIQFVHITFAEYLAANYFVKNRERIAHLNEVIFQTNYTNVRLFFDLLLAKKSQPHIALLHKNYDYVKNVDTEELKNCKDLGGRNLLQLACSWGQSYSFLNIENDDEFYVIDDKDDSNDKPDLPDFATSLTFLFDIFDTEETDNLFKMNAYQYADKANCIYAKIKILQKQNVKSELDDKSVCNLLYYSAKFGYTEALKLFETIPLVKTKKKQDSLLHLSVHYENYFSELFQCKNYQQIIDYKNELGRTALHVTVIFGYDKVAEILLSSGADIDICDNYYAVPLHLAAFYGYNIVSLLIKAGANVNICDKDGRTPLYVAACNGHDNIGALLIKSEANVNICDKDRRTPLYVAACNGHDNIEALLIKSGANVNICDKDGRTPLYAAAYNGHDNIGALLIKSGANVNICDKGGQTHLYAAACNGHDNMVALLIKSGANVNICEKNGQSPLYAAACNGHNNIGTLLIKSGANVNICDKDGGTPLYAAAYNGHDNIGALLIKSGANVNICDNDGGTPLYAAACNSHDNMGALLIKSGANVNICEKNGQSPLYAAACNGHNNIGTLLIKSGANVNICDKDGRTPLYAAAYNGHDKIGTLLIKSGANVNICDKDGQTPLYAAAYNGHDNIRALLIKSGAKVTLVAHLYNGYITIQYNR